MVIDELIIMHAWQRGRWQQNSLRIPVGCLMGILLIKKPAALLKSSDVVKYAKSSISTLKSEVCF